MMIIRKDKTISNKWANDTLNRLEVITEKIFRQTKDATITLTKKIDPDGRAIHTLSKLLLSTSTASALNDIIGTLSTTDDRIKLGPLLANHTTDTILQSAHCLSSLQHRFPLPSPSPLVPPPPSLRSSIVRYSVYSNAVYGWKGRLFSRLRFHRSDVSAICATTGIHRSDVSHASLRSTPRRPAYFISRDREGRNIVLTIRGTLSVADCLADLCVELEHFEADEVRLKDRLGMGPRYAAHGGMLLGAKSIAEEARRKVAALMAVNEGYGLVITGHSLGAGTAAILGTIWRDTFPGVRVFAYGSPCIAPKGNMPTTNGDIVSVVHTGDPFATLSVGHVADVVAGVGYLAGREEVRGRVAEGLRVGGDDRYLENVMGDIRREAMVNEKCYPPGEVYEMGEVEGEVELWKVGRDRWGEMVLRYNILDIPKHVPFLYEDLLKRWNK